MKILSILTYYHPHWTGLTRHAQFLAEGLARRGNSVSVLAVRHHPDLPSEELLNGVRVLRVPAIGTFSRGMIAPSFVLAAARLIRQHDVIQIHTPLPEAPLVALLCRLLGRPLLMSHHGDIVLPTGAPNRSIEIAAYALLSLAARMATRVTSYTSDYAADSRMLRGLGAKLVCILPPVTELPNIPASEHSMRTELALSGRRIIGFAGRWVWEKGFDTLLEALPSLLRTHPDVQLVLAGMQPHYENFLERCRPAIQRVGDRLTFLGLIRERWRMAAFYRLCDVFVLPSRSDMFALVQVEALLCGAPLVASDIPGARVVVRETGAGVLVPPGNPEALANGIRSVLDRPQDYRPDPAVIRRIFDPECSLDRYESLLAEIAR